MSRHKHADLIHKWAEGYRIERYVVPCCSKPGEGFWSYIKNPSWNEDNIYRLAPDQKIVADED